MKTISTLPSLRNVRTAFRDAVVALAVGAIAGHAGADTDLSSTPLQGSSAAQVKPNIMLLLDASGSMGWSHMPDEVETVTGYGSIGYKSYQCNALYYNPNQTYAIPKEADGTPFPLPSFTAAPYAGYISFYSAADQADIDPVGVSSGLNSTIVDLSAAFKAYDRHQLYQTYHNDTPQAAYYFIYSGAQTPNYASAPCTDADTSVPNTVGQTFAATGGGTWTKVIVSATSGIGATVDERQNFAIWYSFYRTRMALIKSAASLAFAPLTNSFRVGFITVEPKDSPTDATIDQNRYVAIDDFGPTQRGIWFSKLFSQSPFGASPTREGLARVGRYYAGKQDGINAGMGGADPMLYSCQQNFTILTTDGYWNAQTETPGGGPVQLDGVTHVGQQDGNAPFPAPQNCPAGDPYCPRPIYDGYSGVQSVATDVSTLYADQACGLPVTYRSTYQTIAQRSQLLQTQTSTNLRTQYYTESEAQALATTTQMTKTTSQVSATTNQFIALTTTLVEHRYQRMKSQDTTTLHTEQWKTQQKQTTSLTKQTTESKNIYYTAKSQYRTTTTQYQTVKTQFQSMVQQYTLGKVQTIRHSYQTIQTDSSQESQYAVSGTCVAGGTISCSTNEIFGPAPSSSCVQGVGPGPDFVKTDCTPGPNTLATAPVASCPVGIDPATAANSYTTTTCTLTTTTPLAFVASCTPGTTTGPNPNYYVTTCSQPVGANNATAFVASCTVGTDPATAANSYVTTVCSKPAGVNNQATWVASCTVGTTPASAGNSYVQTVCDNSSPNNYSATAGAFCTVGTTAPTAGNSYVTTVCTKVLQSTAYKLPATCTTDSGVPASAGNGWVTTSCSTVAVAPHLTATPVDTTVECTSGNGNFNGGGPSFIVTTCANGPNNQAAAPSAMCTVGTTAATSGNQWTTTICTKSINTGPAPSPYCTSVAASAANSWTSQTCVTTQTMPPTAVQPSTCPIGTTSSGTPPYTRTTCADQDLAPLGGICTAGNTGPPNWIQTDCGPVGGGGPVPSCTVGTTTVGNVTTVCTNPIATNFVATCSPSGPTGPNWITTTCNPQTPVVTVGVDPATCVAGVGPGPAFVTTSCDVAAAGPYSNTPVASCTPGYSSGDQLIYACSNPPATNYTKNVQSCTPGPIPPTAGNGYLSYNCVYTETNDVVAGPAPTYCTEEVAASPDWTTKTCTTTPVGAPNTPVATCTAGPSVTCTSTGVQLSQAVATCPTSPDVGPTFYQWTCSDTAPSAPVADAGCVSGTGAGPDFYKTTCTPGTGSGFLRVSTTTTTTTTTNPFGPPTVSPVVGPTVPVDGVCNAAPLPFPIPNPQVQPTVTVNTPLPGGSIDSLADVAQYYYKTDLRPLMADNVPTKGVLPEDDNTPHQHMVTYTLGLGVSGTLNYQADYKTAVTGDFADIRSGAKAWPLWPDPSLDYSGANAINWENKKSIDDFWHTAVDGRGIYFSAANPTSVVSGLSRALNGISASLASSTGQGVSNLNPVAGDNFSYTATYMTGDWTGNVVANTINLTTGALDPTPLWSAQTILDGMTKAQCDNRNIYLARSGAANGMVRFTWNTDTCVGGVPSGSLDTQLNATEQAFFGSTAQQTPVSLLSQWPAMSDGTLGSANQRDQAVGSNLLNYVRGQRGFEPFASGVLNSLYRAREHVLGDIVDSQPVYVKVPFAAYTDAGYDSFKATNANRVPMVYVGANDGMLHAFYAGIDTSDPLAGQEAWAIIPSSVLPNLYQLADDNYRNVHKFFVDGTPVIGDVFDAGSSSWKTVLVTGLNDGGKAYMAVDVTVPTAPKTLWEFKWDPAVCPAPEPSPAAHGDISDCHLGYSYGKPVITKLTDGTWVVLVTSGYNNINSPPQTGDGVGYLYVLDAMTGVVKAKISTGVGDATNPAGLAQINNFVDNAMVDNTTVRAYGGDLLGNIWRFDINGTPAVTLVGTATDKATGTPQSITTRPELAEVNNKPMIFVGTGRYLGASDIAIVQQQSVYGIIDPLTAGPVYASPDLRTALQPLVMTNVGSPVTSRTVACDPTAPAGACTRTAGWVLDLGEAGERVNVGMQLLSGTLIVGTNVPQDTACSSGGHSWINFLNYSTGLAVSNDPSTPVSQYLADSLLVGLSTISLPPQAGYNNPTQRFIGMLGNGQPTSGTPPINSPPPSGKRVSWREIAN